MQIEESVIHRGADLLPMLPRFRANIPSIYLVSKPVYHRINGILLESAKFGQRRLVMKN